MANMVLSLQEFTFDAVHDKFSSTIGSNDKFHGSSEDWGDSQHNHCLVSHDFAFYQQQQQQQQQSFSEYGLLDNLQYDMLSPPIQACLDEITKLGESPSINVVETKKENQCSFTLSSLKLLKNYGDASRRLRGEKMETIATNTSSSRELSTEDVFKIAGAKFIQSSSQIVDLPSILSHPFGLYFSGLSDEETRDVELAEFLLAAAEKVGNQQLERASRLLNQYDYLSCKKGNPVQRVVYYFSEALREKIDREMGRSMPKDLGKQQLSILEEALMVPSTVVLACHEEMPFSQIVQFAGIQAVVENVAGAKKVHIIDLAIRNGVQWTVLMQALSARCECPVELLTITAVGTTAKHLIEDTGKRLSSFSQSMSFRFCFKIVMVSEMVELKEELFELDHTEEAIVVYAQLVLRTMIVQPNQLESLMRVVKSINPRIVIIHEVEANHNSPVFVSRFIEALFFFSAYFDCLEACMERDDPNRMITESYFRQGIRNMVAVEGDERSIRSVKIDVWRVFFARFGMVETELSASSLYQANLVLKRFACGSCCTFDMNGKSLIIGWKGTPIHSLSVWNFC